MVKLTHEDTQKIKAAFYHNSVGQPKMPKAHLDNFLVTAKPGITYEELAKLEKKEQAEYDVSEWFAIINSDAGLIAFIQHYFQPMADQPKEEQVDGLEVKAAKGF